MQQAFFHFIANDDIVQSSTQRKAENMSNKQTKENATDTTQETPQGTAESEPTPGKAELAALENAIFRKHIDAMNAELAELRAKYDINTDPADTLTGEVRELKEQFSELKTLLQNLTAQVQQVQQGTQTQPMPQPMQWQTAQPQHFGVPYIQTPNYTPLMPAATTIFR
jgi:chromosome segregation ATPase